GGLQEGRLRQKALELRQEGPRRLEGGAVTLLLHLGASTENTAGDDPAVDVPSVVADLETRSLNRLDEVEVLATPHFAQHDFAYLDCRGIDRLDGAKLPGFDLARHGMAARPKRDRFAILKFRDVMRGPTHAVCFLHS